VTTATHTVRSARRLRSAALLAALLACATCTHGDITVVEPAAKGPNDSLALTIVPDGEDAAAAAALGWKAGIPGAEVIIAPSVKPNADGPGDTATGPPIATLVTDSTGHVSVPDLPSGWYYIEVRRWLTGAERGRLTAGADLIGFATHRVVQRGSATLTLPGSHRRSIVISEASSFVENVTTTTAYGYGGYLELANNSDTTVYLDGLVIGLFFAATESSVFPGRCAREGPFLNDPDGIWVYYMDSLPGTGHDYALAPGALALIATDAIDHRPLSPLFGLDLSQANFEMVGTEDADNPSVPNSVVIGPNGAWDPLHGMLFSVGLASAIVVALPVDTGSLPKRLYDPHQGYATAWQERIPRDHILDVLDAFWPNLVTVYNELCPFQVSSTFDRQPAPLWWSSLPDGTWWSLSAYSIQRKAAFTRADGRMILQDTRSTEADFYVGLRTPFQLP